MKQLAIVLLGLGLVGAAHCDVKVESVVISQSAPNPRGTNIRVNMLNDGITTDVAQHVELQARAAQTAEWKTVKTWNVHTKVASGNRLSLDYLPGADGFMDPALTSPTFEVRALVTGRNGGQHSMEQAFTR